MSSYTSSSRQAELRHGDTINKTRKTPHIEVYLLEESVDEATPQTPRSTVMKRSSSRRQRRAKYEDDESLEWTYQSHEGYNSPSGGDWDQEGAEFAYVKHTDMPSQDQQRASPYKLEHHQQTIDLAHSDDAESWETPGPPEMEEYLFYGDGGTQRGKGQVTRPSGAVPPPLKCKKCRKKVTIINELSTSRERDA
jgi:hypothetical protein